MIIECVHVYVCVCPECVKITIECVCTCPCVHVCVYVSPLHIENYTTKYFAGFDNCLFL